MQCDPYIIFTISTRTIKHMDHLNPTEIPKNTNADKCSRKQGFALLNTNDNHAKMNKNHQNDIKAEQISRHVLRVHIC